MDSTKELVISCVKEYFKTNLYEYFKSITEDIKQIDEKIEQIGMEQDKISLVLSASPAEITKKDQELFNVINAYIAKVKSVKKETEESLEQIFDDLNSKAVKGKDDTTRQLAEVKDMLEKQKELLRQLNDKKAEAQGMIDDIVKLSDIKIDKLLQEKSASYLTKFNKATSESTLEALENIRALIEKAELLNQKLSDSYEKMEEEINDSKDAIINAVVKEASEKLIEINPCKCYEINIGDWHSSFKSGELFHKKFKQVLTLAAMKKPVLLKGPAGSGKNVIIEQVAKALNLQFYYTNDVTDEFKILGYMDANGTFQKTQFFRAFTEGGVMFIDEIDNSNPSALLAINSAIGTGDSHYMAFPDGQFYKAHPDFRIIAAANTFGTGADAIYCGRQALDGASLNRFSPIIIDYDREIERKVTNNSEILELYWNVRDIINKNGIRHVISTRNIINATDLINSKAFSIEEIFDLTLIQSLDNFSLITIAKNLDPYLCHADDLLHHLSANYNADRNAFDSNNGQNNYNGRQKNKSFSGFSY